MSKTLTCLYLHTVSHVSKNSLYPARIAWLAFPLALVKYRKHLAHQLAFQHIIISHNIIIIYIIFINIGVLL